MCFINDKLTEEVIEALSCKGVKNHLHFVAGFNNVNLDAAKKRNIAVCGFLPILPKLLPKTVAMLDHQPQKHKAYNRVREQKHWTDYWNKYSWENSGRDWHR